MKKLEVKDLKENFFEAIGKEWMLVTAGTKEKFNTMTASWGGIGWVWNKPVAFVFIRPERYTYEFVEENDHLTLSFLGEENKKIHAVCGSKSGRNIDKVKETGLKPGIPICAGAGDTMQSMIGCGVIKPDQAADVAGTCAMFCIATDGINEELSKPENELIFNSGTLENTYFYWGFIRTGGLALRWYRDNVCNEAGNGAYFDELNEKAQNVPCGSKGVLFLPYLTGGFGETSNASACFLNMTMDTDQGVQWRAVLEAIGYDYMSVTDIYKKAGVPLEFMTITEGGSNSEVWNQIKADMLGCKSATLENAQGAVLTDAVIAAYAVGDLEDPSQVFEKTRKIKKIYEPDPIRTKYYRSIYEQQRKLIKDDMAAVFKTLHQISKIQEQSND